MVKANGLIDIPVEVEKLKPGDVVDVQVFGSWGS
jgi:molybdopterin biosynthesis enzyme